MGFIYKPLHQAQLAPGTGPTGKYDCTAYSAAMAIDRATLGGCTPTGRQVRLASNEPYPDPDSPGLNLQQIVVVAAKWHVDLFNRYRAPWASVLAVLKEGHGVVLQGDYDQIPTAYSGQLSFKGDHAVYVNHITGDGDLYWMDPLRKAGSIEMPVKYAQAYAEKLAKSWGIYPGLAWAMTRDTPNLGQPS